MKYATARPMPTPKKHRAESSKSPTRSSQCKDASISRRSTSRFCFAIAAARPSTCAGLKLAIERGWLKMHESGTFVTFTPAGAELYDKAVDGLKTDFPEKVFLHGQGRVEMWRGGFRLHISVSASFVWRCLSGVTVTPFPHPAHRTGQAALPHPALGQDLTPSPTACRAHARLSVRARSARKGARVDKSRPCIA